MDSTSFGSPTAHRCASDEEAYATISSAPPKRRAGRTKFHETRHPVYKGVRRRNADRWVCEVREPHKKSRIWLGTFPTPEMAARAHDVAAMALRGKSACLNFADSAWLLPVPKSPSPKDIQKAAAEAAEMFRPSSAEMSRGSMEEVERVQEATEECMEHGFAVDGEVYVPSFIDDGLLSPPHWGMQQWQGSEECSYWDDVECNAEVSLWSYSI